MEDNLTMPGYRQGTVGLHSDGELYGRVHSRNSSELGTLSPGYGGFDVGREYCSPLTNGDVVGCAWDVNHNAIWFTVNGELKSRAFENVVNLISVVNKLTTLEAFCF